MGPEAYVLRIELAELLLALDRYTESAEAAGAVPVDELEPPWVGRFYLVYATALS